MNGFYKLKKQ